MKNEKKIEIINKSKNSVDVKFKNETPPGPDQIPEIPPALPGDPPPPGVVDEIPQVIDPAQVETDSIPCPTVDLFSDLDGVLPDGVTYTIYKMGEKTGKQEYVTTVPAPYSVQMIANNFGGGDYLIMAREPKTGKYIRRKNIPISRDIYDFEEPGGANNSRMELLKEMKMYKELFDSSSKIDTGFMDVMTKQVQMIMQMSNNMMLQQMEMMKQFQEQLGEGGGGDITAIASLVEKFASGKITGLPNLKKDKTGTEGK